MGDAALDAEIMQLQKELAAEQDRSRQLEEQYKYRVGAFVKRETLAKKTVEALERKMAGSYNAEEEHRQRMNMIRNMHDSVMGAMTCIQSNTGKILQDQEKDLMRAFRSRLQDVSKDLESHRRKKGDVSADLQARHRRVVAELRASQELAHKFDKKHQQLQLENAQLQEALRKRVDDRATLVKDLVVARREITRLKGVAEKKTPLPRQSESYLDEPMPSLGGSTSQPALTTSTRNVPFEQELKLREQIRKEQTNLELAKRTTASWRDSQRKHLAQRAEIEIFLRQCVDDVKRELHKAHNMDDSEETHKLVEVLRAEERVVHLLYGKCFPNRGESVTPAEDDALQTEEFGELLESVGNLPPI